MRKKVMQIYIFIYMYAKDLTFSLSALTKFHTFRVLKRARKWHYEKSLCKQKRMICLQSDFFEFKRAKALVRRFTSPQW